MLDGISLTEADEKEAIVLHEPSSSKFIECYVHSYAKVSGNEEINYVVAVPCDPCIEICEVDASAEDNDQIFPIDEGDERMDNLFSLASALLEEDDLFLVRSAATLTLQGDLEMAEDVNSLEDEELASFEVEGAEYVLLRIVAPLFLVAKQEMSPSSSDEKYELLEDEELRIVSTLVQRELDEQFNIQAESE